MTETALSRAIRKSLTLKGCWVIRVQSGTIPIAGKHARFVHCAEPGTPDLLMLAPGVCFLEVKTVQGRTRPAQTKWHARALRHGVPVRIVRSVSDALSVAEEFQQASTSATGGEALARAAREKVAGGIRR